MYLLGEKEKTNFQQNRNNRIKLLGGCLKILRQKTNAFFTMVFQVNNVFRAVYKRGLYKRQFHQRILTG